MLDLDVMGKHIHCICKTNSEIKHWTFLKFHGDERKYLYYVKIETINPGIWMLTLIEVFFYRNISCLCYNDFDKLWTINVANSIYELHRIEIHCMQVHVYIRLFLIMEH